MSENSSSEKFDARWRALARRRYRRFASTIYLVILSIGLALGTLVYWQGQRVIGVTMGLITEDMHSQQIIADLEASVIRIEPVLYEYYATEDSGKFRAAYKRLSSEYLGQIDMLAVRFPDRDELRRIPAFLDAVNGIAGRLDRNLAAPDTDWDLAREALAAISEKLFAVRGALDQLAASIRNQVAMRGSQTRKLVNETVMLALVFAAVTFLTVLVIGYFVTNALTTGLHRRWLATFPERNPNPILSIGDDGAILYANPSAAKMIGDAASVSEAMRTLLPSDTMSRLERMAQNGIRYHRWEYAIDDRIYGCGIHHLPDIGVYHAYISDITKRKRDEQQLEWAAYHDALTGLPNRRRFTEDLQTALASKSNGAVLAISIDRFRELAEGMGHDISDAVLTAVGQRLDTKAKTLANGGCPLKLYHFGGDHFAFLADNPACSQGGVLTFAERVIESFRTPLSAADREFFVTMSIGVNYYQRGAGDWTTVVKRAESALQQVRRDGGCAVREHTADLEGETLKRLELEQALRRAVDAGDLHLEFQPLLNVATDAVQGMEALVRWHHPNLGMVSPASFIPIAEETGMIDELGRWVLWEACRQTVSLRQSGYRDIWVAVNVSPRQIADPSFPQIVAETLNETGLPGSALQLEITETAAMQNPGAAIQVLGAIRQLGVAVAIDDFGTGYSSLAYLKTLPLNKLKIDRSFVRVMGDSRDDAAIVAATVGLAHKLGLAVTAEGVETQEQLNRLVALGCDEIQGFLIARPLNVDALVDFLADRLGVVAERAGI